MPDHWMHPDLFAGKETPIFHPISSHARPAPLGSGPEGERCQTCLNLIREEYHGTTYFKCGLMQSTRGPGTDLRLTDAACFRWTVVR